MEDLDEKLYIIYDESITKFNICMDDDINNYFHRNTCVIRINNICSLYLLAGDVYIYDKENKHNIKVELYVKDPSYIDITINSNNYLFKLIEHINFNKINIEPYFRKKKIKKLLNDTI